MPRHAVIELTLPAGWESEGGDGECCICARGFCAGECPRAVVELRCCAQSICAGCVVKLARACSCQEECEAIVALCPFCRDIAGLSAREVFLGGAKSECAGCAPKTATNDAEVAEVVIDDADPR